MHVVYLRTTIMAQETRDSKRRRREGPVCVLRAFILDRLCGSP
jgi:hypothetical protein